jgi:thioredoxin 1
MSISPRSLGIVGIVAVVAVAVVVANQKPAAPQSEMPAPITLGQSAALSQGAGAATGTPDAAAPSTAPSTARSPRRKLLFFINPDGYPCQTQQAILAGVADSLSKVADVVYVSTTVPADLRVFEAYGIRALPSLIIVDADGRELSRFAPGIQPADAVLAALTK